MFDVGNDENYINFRTILARQTKLSIMINLFTYFSDLLSATLWIIRLEGMVSVGEHSR